MLPKCVIPSYILLLRNSLNYTPHTTEIQYFTFRSGPYLFYIENGARIYCLLGIHREDRPPTVNAILNNDGPRYTFCIYSVSVCEGVLGLKVNTE